MTTSANASTATARRPPTVLRVVGPAAADAYHAPVDWSDWYLTDEDDMGESPQQSAIIRLLRPSVEWLLRERGTADDVFVGADAFFAWMPEEPNVRVSPDVYIMPSPPEGQWPRMWRTWDDGIGSPTLAIEVVSEDWQKEYRVNPPKYAMLGVRELIVFDPDAPSGHDVRERLTIYRNSPDGQFYAAHAGDGPAWSEELSIWFVLVPSGQGLVARLARDPSGRDLVPTHEERADSEQARADSEQARADAAERRLAELMAEVAELRSQTETGTG